MAIRERERSATLGAAKSRVRFRPGGNRNERTGIILETEIEGRFGTMYFIEDDRGERHTVAPDQVVAAEETHR